MPGMEIKDLAALGSLPNTFGCKSAYAGQLPELCAPAGRPNSLICWTFEHLRTRCGTALSQCKQNQRPARPLGSSFI
jgi:hypothetical protein